MKPTCYICLQKTQLVRIACAHQLCESCRHQILKKTLKCPFCRQCTLSDDFNPASTHIYCRENIIESDCDNLQIIIALGNRVPSINYIYTDINTRVILSINDKEQHILSHTYYKLNINKQDDIKIKIHDVKQMTHHSITISSKIYNIFNKINIKPDFVPNLSKLFEVKY